MSTAQLLSPRERAVHERCLYAVSEKYSFAFLFFVTALFKSSTSQNPPIRGGLTGRGSAVRYTDATSLFNLGSGPSVPGLSSLG
jgi:hypothetical protein